MKIIVIWFEDDLIFGRDENGTVYSQSLHFNTDSQK